MAKTQKNLNDKSSDYIEENILKDSPEGLEPIKAAVEEGEIVVANHIPPHTRITFHNGRDPGVPLGFHYHSKTHPLKQYKLFHGAEYDLPNEIIDHLEEKFECQYGYRKGPDEQPEMYVKGKKHIFRCQPVKNK